MYPYYVSYLAQYKNGQKDVCGEVITRDKKIKTVKSLLEVKEDIKKKQKCETVIFLELIPLAK